MPDVTFAEFGKQIGISGAAVTKLKNRGVLDGALVKKKGAKRPKLDLEKAVKAYHDKVHPNFKKDAQSIKQKKPSGGNGDGKSGDTRFVDARTARELINAQNAKLDYEIKKDLWIQKKEVQDYVFGSVRVMRDVFLNIPARTASLVAAKSKKKEKEIYQILRKEMRRGLEDCIEQLKILAG